MRFCICEKCCRGEDIPDVDELPYFPSSNEQEPFSQAEYIHETEKVEVCG